MVNKVSVECLVCGKTLLKNPSDAKRFKVCSLECRGKYSAMKYSKRIEKRCEVCGDSFSVKPSHADVRFTCSTDCKYKRLEEHLSTLNGKGKDSINWRGGKFISPAGYVFIYDPENPMANSRGYVREHRLVMSKHLGRTLTEDEIVHHIDGDKSNNSINNLEIMTNAEHTALHAKERAGERRKHSKGCDA